jgi:hypothetical protein
MAWGQLGAGPRDYSITSRLGNGDRDNLTKVQAIHALTAQPIQRTQIHDSGQHEKNSTRSAQNLTLETNAVLELGVSEFKSSRQCYSHHVPCF